MANFFNCIDLSSAYFSIQVCRSQRHWYTILDPKTSQVYAKKRRKLWKNKIKIFSCPEYFFHNFLLFFWHLVSPLAYKHLAYLLAFFLCRISSYVLFFLLGVIYDHSLLYISMSDNFNCNINWHTRPFFSSVFFIFMAF